MNTDENFFYYNETEPENVSLKFENTNANENRDSKNNSIIEETTEITYSLNKILDIKLGKDNEDDAIETSFNCLDLFFGKLKSAKLSFITLINADYSELTVLEKQILIGKKLDLFSNLFSKSILEKHADEIKEFFNNDNKEDFGVYLHLLSNNSSNSNNTLGFGIFEIKGFTEFSDDIQKKLSFLLNSLSEFIFIFKEDINKVNIQHISGISSFNEANSYQEDTNMKEQYSILPDIIILYETDRNNHLFKHFKAESSKYSNLSSKRVTDYFKDSIGKMSNKEVSPGLLKETEENLNDLDLPLNSLEEKIFYGNYIKKCKKCFMYFLEISKLPYCELLSNFGKTVAESLHNSHIDVYNDVQALYLFFNFNHWNMYLTLYGNQINGSQVFGLIQSK